MKKTRIAGMLACAAMAGALAGCAGTLPTHYYSLMPAPGQTVAGMQAAPATKAAHSYVISVGSVSVPEQVDRPQIVLAEPDSTQVTPLNGFLWAASLSEEMRRALADDLSRRLGVLEAPTGAARVGMGLWQVNVSVQRFDSYFGKQAVLDASWSLRPQDIAGARPADCRARISVPVGDGVSSLVQGHQQALWTLSGLIAGHIQPVAQGQEDQGEVQFKRCS